MAAALAKKIRLAQEAIELERIKYEAEQQRLADEAELERMRIEEEN